MYSIFIVFNFLPSIRCGFESFFIPNYITTPLRKILVNKHLTELYSRGETVCPSPLLRKLIYEELERQDVKFTSAKVGEGKILTFNYKVKRSMYYSPRHLIKLRNKGKLTYDILKCAYDRTSYGQDVSVPIRRGHRGSSR